MVDRRVLVSIVNWNGGDTILDCLKSLSESQFQSFDVVVTDNASVDGSLDKIRAAFPSTIVVQNSDNLGFCGGQNRGLALAAEQGYEYVWMLNHDTLIDAAALGALVSALDGEPRVAMVSPVIVDSGENIRIQYCGTSVDLGQCSFQNWETIELALNAQDSHPRTFFLWGTALLIRVSALAKVGKLDERFFAYYEDYDLSLRIVHNGYLNKIVANARIVHFGDHDSSQRPAHHVYFNTRNRALFWSKHLPRMKRLAFWREYLSGALIRASCFDEAHDTERMNATLLGIWDALTGRGGRFDKGRKVAPRVARLLMSHPYVLADMLRGNLTAIVKRRLTNER